MYLISCLGFKREKNRSFNILGYISKGLFKTLRSTFMKSKSLRVFISGYKFIILNHGVLLQTMPV